MKLTPTLEEVVEHIQSTLSKSGKRFMIPWDTAKTMFPDVVFDSPQAWARYMTKRFKDWYINVRCGYRTVAEPIYEWNDKEGDCEIAKKEYIVFIDTLDEKIQVALKYISEYQPLHDIEIASLMKLTGSTLVELVKALVETGKVMYLECDRDVPVTRFKEEIAASYGDLDMIHSVGYMELTEDNWESEAITFLDPINIGNKGPFVAIHIFHRQMTTISDEEAGCILAEDALGRYTSIELKTRF